MSLLLLKDSNLPNQISKLLKPHSSKPPRLYGLPKIQKEQVPLRPIASTIGAPTYEVAKYRTGLLWVSVHTMLKIPWTLSNFLDTLQSAPSDILVSFDIISLFTQVSVKKLFGTA